MTDKQNEEKTPRVFISYSHDSPEHKRWVLSFAERLVTNGIDAIIDAWDCRPGDDIPKFMERGLLESDRVLLICSARYVAKANEGVGGVGYEAMIVTSELAQNLGSAKFVPIIRQSNGEHLVPTFVSTRRYVDISEGCADAEFEFSRLIDDLHNILPAKPPLGRRPQRASAVSTLATFEAPSPSVPVDVSPSALDNTVAPALDDPAAVFRRALMLAQASDLLQWRRLVTSCRARIQPLLRAWAGKYASTYPGDIKVLIEQSMEGAAAFSPLTAAALGGVASANSRYENQAGLLEDILNPTEWQRSGLVARVELPETGAFVYEALCGAMCLYMENARAAMNLACTRIPHRQTGGTLPLWQSHNVTAWPEALGRNCTAAFRVLLSLPARWTWVREIFGGDIDYEAALYAYYVALNALEYMDHLRGTKFPQSYQEAWPAHVPPVFELASNDAKRRGYSQLMRVASQLKAFWSSLGADERPMREHWPTWVAIQNHWNNTEFSRFDRPVYYESLVPQVLDAPA